MLRKFFRVIIRVISSLLILVVLCYLVIYFKTQARINKEYQVSLQSLKIYPDSLSYARGKHVATNWGCMGCHGNDLGGGMAFLDENSPVGLLYAANITSGKGGIQFRDEDWVRVLRHGLNKENKSIWLMPSQDIYRLSNQDMADLIGFVKKQPPVDRIVPAHSLKPLGRVLTFLNKFPLLSAERIDQDAVFQDSVKFAVTTAYGAYLATTCWDCHGNNMKGGPAHGPNEPPAPDISSTGEVGKWTSEDLIKVFRKGITPAGKQLNDAMPWKVFSYSDEELQSIYLYLQSVK